MRLLVVSAALRRRRGQRLPQQRYGAGGVRGRVFAGRRGSSVLVLVLMLSVGAARRVERTRRPLLLLLLLLLLLMLLWVMVVWMRRVAVEQRFGRRLAASGILSF